VTTRLSNPDDADALARLMMEMQAHYRVPCPDQAAIVESLVDLPPGTRILLAETDHIVGFGAFSAVYPGPGLRKGLFLKELFVSGSARGQGHGSAILTHLAQIAIEEGYGRIDWTASRNDPGLRAFYRSLGSVEQEDKLFFRLTGNAMIRLATGPSRN
jgi:GNAT superfamily N-acetyltransferase